MTDEVLFRVEGHAGIISLNKPGTIHALTLAMVHAMTAMLLKWKKSRSVKAIIIEHAEGRGFCAGGDISWLRDAAIEGKGRGRQFFHDEYQLDHLLFTYPKPVISFIDGIVMGGGVGIALPARFRIATENTRFAMPEVGIGLFPDVGGSWYLSRLEGRVGQYLALTGARIDGADCNALGLATHYLPSEVLAEAKQRIATDDPERIEGILGTLAVQPPEAKILEHIIPINQNFAADRLEEILVALDADDSDWAIRERATLMTKSPTSCKVALRQLVEGAGHGDFAETLCMEYRIAHRLCVSAEFVEGVRAVIVDKDNAPKWDPETPEAVTEDLINVIFATLPKGEEWKPL